MSDSKSFRDPICLNVGGSRYSTSLATLTKYPDSMLGRMFGGDFPAPTTDRDGAFFIDRDGIPFRFILNFLRSSVGGGGGAASSTCLPPANSADRDALKIEADFYQIAPLIDALEEEEEQRRAPEDPVRLNVGGVVFITRVEVLTKYPDSLPCCLMDGSVPASRDADGTLFIDRDGALFRHVLNFMREDRLLLPDGFSEVPALAAEAEFYQIAPLATALRKFLTEDRQIEIVECSDFGRILVRAPSALFNHPNFPFNIHPRDPQRGVEANEIEQECYIARGYHPFLANRNDFCDALRALGCKFLTFSVSVTNRPTGRGDNILITKRVEKWSYNGQIQIHRGKARDITYDF